MKWVAEVRKDTGGAASGNPPKFPLVSALPPDFTFKGRFYCYLWIFIQMILGHLG